MMEPIKITITIMVPDGGMVHIEPTEIPFQTLSKVTKDTTITFTLKCDLWAVQRGDKPAKSCEGCKVAGCLARGRYSGEPMTV